MGRRADFSLALIAGGSSGIGLALARLLAGRGTSVILAARNAERLETAAAEVRQAAAAGAQVSTLALDVSDAAAVEGVLPAFLEGAGTPDLLYNGAGMAYPDHFEKIPLAVFRNTMDINVGGAWNVLQVLIPLMKKAGRGTVVNVSSVSGFLGTYGYTAYAASKFALMGLSQCLRNEMSAEGIDVKVLCPPDTDTPQLAQEDETKPEETRRINGNAGIMSADAVASAVLRALDRSGAGRRGAGRSGAGQSGAGRSGAGRGPFLILPGQSRFAWMMYRFFPALVHRLIDRDVRMVRRGR